MECGVFRYACRNVVISVLQSLPSECAIQMAHSKDLFCLSTLPLGRGHNGGLVLCSISYELRKSLKVLSVNCGPLSIKI